MVARMVTYRFKVDPHELAKKAEEGLLPIFMKQPGFRDYSLFADRDDPKREVRQIIALTLWDSLEEANEGIAQAWQWVDDNMIGELEWTDTEFMDVLLSTSFGVSASWEDIK